MACITKLRLSKVFLDTTAQTAVLPVVTAIPGTHYDCDYGSYSTNLFQQLRGHHPTRCYAWSVTPATTVNTNAKGEIALGS